MPLLRSALGLRVVVGPGRGSCAVLQRVVATVLSHSEQPPLLHFFTSQPQCSGRCRGARASGSWRPETVPACPHGGGAALGPFGALGLAAEAGGIYLARPSEASLHRVSKVPQLPLRRLLRGSGSILPSGRLHLRLTSSSRSAARRGRASTVRAGPSKGLKASDFFQP